MNTIKEVKGKLAELISAMVEKGVVTPDASFSINTEKCNIVLRTEYSSKMFDNSYMKIVYGTTPGKTISAAFKYIAALPNPDEQVTREYLSKVADAVDYATKNSIADEYVTPLRGVTCAMTENLLTEERVSP